MRGGVFEKGIIKCKEFDGPLKEPIKDISGVKVELIKNIIGHQPFGVYISLDSKVLGVSNEELVEKLKNMTPSIWTRIPEGEDRLCLHVFGLNEGEPEIVGEAIKKAII